ncbi:MAG: hypothetical protein MK135_03390 [Polyangiaceae bacterium]|nr:hypothetical protein [Polyangiaceae bacterium]
MVKKKSILGAAVVSAAMTFASSASALDTVDKGTMYLGVERLVALGIETAGSTNFGMTILPNRTQMNFQFARVGFDYFVINGLSIGGTAGMQFATQGSSSAFAFVPRVGYAFALSRKIDFWPRGGFGILGAGGNARAYMPLEAMFNWKFSDPLYMQFGGTVDFSFGNRTVFGLGGAAGLTLNFESILR